ncbi:hypothetical protein ACFWM3_24785, partial [Gottfriedia sp. NPDC058432]|uniref:hypothetical protein n=1 Tax=Gottfriedia sp. NPDC058432 TaxID=3346497 RepID=UPI00364C652A
GDFPFNLNGKSPFLFHILITVNKIDCFSVASASLRGLSLPANPIGVEHPSVPINLFIKKQSATKPNQIAFT